MLSIYKYKFSFAESLWFAFSKINYSGNLRELFDSYSSEYESTSNEKRMELLQTLCELSYPFRYIVHGYKQQFQEMERDEIVNSLYPQMHRLLKMVIELQGVDLNEYKKQIPKFVYVEEMGEIISKPQSYFLDILINEDGYAFMDVIVESEYIIADIIQKIIAPL